MLRVKGQGLMVNDSVFKMQGSQLEVKGKKFRV